MVAKRLWNETLFGDNQGRKEKVSTTFSMTLKDVNKKFDQPVRFEIKMNNITLFSDTDIPVKNFGKMLRLKKDIRFISYDKLFEGNRRIIDYKSYINEEECFDKCRVQAVKLCHELEKKLLEKGLISDSPNKGYYPFSELIDIIVHRVSNNNFNSNFINNARNMFLHNEYKKVCINNVEIMIAEKVYNLFSKKLEHIMECL